MDMIKMMKKAADLQKNMKKKQQELSKVKVQNSFDGVSVEINCDMTISSVKITQELVNSADIDKIDVHRICTEFKKVAKPYFFI